MSLRIRNKIAVNKYRNKNKNNSDYKLSKSISHKKWCMKNIEKLKQSQSNYYKTLTEEKRINRRKVSRKSYIKQTFKISIEQYEDMKKSQNYCCAICGKNEKECHRSLRLDHNHINGKIRKFLCNNCNLLIGHSFESIDILKKSIEYLTMTQ